MYVPQIGSYFKVFLVDKLNKMYTKKIRISALFVIMVTLVNSVAFVGLRCKTVA